MGNIPENVKRISQTVIGVIDESTPALENLQGLVMALAFYTAWHGANEKSVHDALTDAVSQYKKIKSEKVTRA